MPARPKPPASTLQNLEDLDLGKRFLTVEAETPEALVVPATPASARLYYQRPQVGLYLGHVIDCLRLLPSRSVHMVVTSPPYWGLRDYGTGTSLELGSEECPQIYVNNMVEVFSQVARVMRKDGTLWLNLGDTYGDQGLYGIPWRVALALQEVGWYLRMDIIWCLSGATWVYVRSQKGDMPMTIKDLARLDPTTVKLWNGDKWTQLLGVSKTPRNGTEIQLVLRSGETINCTRTHQFPTKNRGLVAAGDIKVGDVLLQVRLPEPEQLKDSVHIGKEAAFLAGLYLAEGSGVEKYGDKFSLAGHAKETGRWNRVLNIARSYGGTATLRIKGSNQTITVYGKVVSAVVRELVGGLTAKDKCFNSVVWRYSNEFIESMMDGYLHGDGGKDTKNDRHRLGFARNHSLARDLRTACARLGWTITLRPKFAMFDGRRFPSYRGEIRQYRSGHLNEKDRCEVIYVGAAVSGPSKAMYDIGVEDTPNVFALSSGVLTHNSKPSPMPEPATDRCTRAHEYLFQLTTSRKYYYDAEGIKEKVGEITTRNSKFRGISSAYKNNASYNNSADVESLSRRGEDSLAGRNKRSVWTVAGQGYPGAHFATFPPKLIEPCILAGTSAKGVCPECGAQWCRVVDKQAATRERPNQYVKRTGQEGTGNSCANGVAGVNVNTLGWEPGCACGHEEVVPAVVLDPFIGSGTTAEVAILHNRRCVGIDLSELYLRDHAVPRVEKAMREYARNDVVRGRYKK